ncbi:LysE family translocator [Brevibacillus porteri]|uniref:RhtB family transporter n=1 Tax=Brevibacillus porteri TaxID=2126350 RepID=A0ABX5FWW7_9BACL|nr:LysE family translocator [Brevibacillus porteri]MED1800965.1 LysE family translocator [Brevibacillus porteri]MED2130351.1 LysE family translocator [Brevibacillus porteri]MED2743000.1 LysE family translocator [Brevibacillus porteri]MED2812591.1 LysE family translocator [Brevibacillus porteri]MED2895435.1 LysE family translocator [Brevibacillus porteri]
MEFSTIWLFVIAASTLLIIPGPAVFYIMARSIDQGKKAGLVSVLGVSLGGSVHVLAGAIGVSAILMTSATAFHIVKYLGAAYLIYLGCKTLFSKADRTDSEIPKAPRKKLRKIFYESALVEVMTALFFLAFFPQFISPTAGSVTVQFLLLGTIFIILAFVSDGLYAVLAASMRKRIVGSTATSKVVNRITGYFYIALGIFSAFASPSKT